MESSNADSVIRVMVQQPALAHYRVSVFAALASRPGIHCRIYYGQTSDLPNVKPAGFDAVYVPQKRLRLLSRHLVWHGPQWRCARKGQCDVLMLSWDVQYISLLAGLLRAKWNRIPVVLWGHGYSKREAGWRRLIRNRVARLATALLFYNHTVARQFATEGWDPQRLFVALNSLDQAPIAQARDHWLARPAELEAFRRQHNLVPGRTILFVSRFDPDNRVDLLIEAVARLAPKYPGVKAVIIGKGEPEGQRLRDLAARLNVGPQVMFPGAIYGQLELAPWFLCSDLFCYPANIGLSILHAFGYGLPVVTDDNVAAQNPEIEALRDGETGFLYRAGDAGALAQCLGRLLGDAALRQRLGQNARRLVEEEFTIGRMVDGMEAAIRYCMSTWRSPSFR